MGYFTVQEKGKRIVIVEHKKDYTHTGQLGGAGISWVGTNGKNPGEAPKGKISPGSLKENARHEPRRR